MIDRILEAMKGADSKAPVSEELIAQRTGMTLPALQTQLEAMFTHLPSMVNRAEITRGGVKAMYYWPTGVVDAASWKTFNIMPPKAVKVDSVGVRHAQIKQQENNVATKTFEILKHIENNPGATTADLAKLTGTLDTKNYVKAYAERGLVVFGQNEHGKRTWSLKEGWTAEQVYETRQGGSNYIEIAPKAVTKAPEPAPTEAPIVFNATQESVTAKDDFEIPAFLRKPQLPIVEKPAPGDGVKVDVMTGKNIETGEQVMFNSKPNTEPASAPTPALNNGDTFRCAYTNDGCLMLLGLQIMPIELNAAQTNDLIDFISETITPIGVAL